MGPPPGGPTSTAASDDEVVELLRVGDEATYRALIDEHGAALIRTAMIYVTTRAVAEEVVQETWVGVLRGLDRFAARSSLKTWVFRILTNTAKTRAQRDRRTIPFSALDDRLADAEPAVEPRRFRPDDDPLFPRHWASPPTRWDLPEERVLASELRTRIEGAIETLPPSQRAVITSRDVQGWSSLEVCNALDITETNQRVLLHRARSKVRRALEDYISRTER